MAKYEIGQKLFMDKYNTGELVPVVITSWRGGGVAPYEVKLLDGTNKKLFASARDMIAVSKCLCGDEDIIDAPCDEISTADKLDLLLEHLGLEIKVEPKKAVIVKQDNDQSS